MRSFASWDAQPARLARLYVTGGATAVLERAFDHDLEDVRAMIARGLVDPGLARSLFDRIEPELYRFPAIDPASFRARIERELASR